MDPAAQPVFGACMECGAGYGERHWPGCGTASADPHPGWSIAQHDSARGAAVCRERGWSVAFVNGEGWRPCDPEDAGAYVDLGRYAFWIEHGDAALHGADGDPAPPGAR